jgi:ureidoacrylate peracid hydrolase
VPQLKARPESLEVDFSRTAVVVVDMQNGFASKGGMLDIAGVDISGAPAVVQSIGKVVAAARGAGIPIIFLQMGFKPDLSNSGGPESPNWHKELKTRYSGFARTTLDAELSARGIRYLLFMGIATNVCVESTLRDAFFLDYWPILIADAAMAAGSPAMHDATLFNVESFFGWTVAAEELLGPLRIA